MKKILGVLSCIVSSSVFAKEKEVSITPYQTNDYYKALAKGHREHDNIDWNREESVKAPYEKLSWAGKIAWVNYFCSKSRDKCFKILTLARQDKALMVRDHALKISLVHKEYTRKEKIQFAIATISLDENYRNGHPLWIVERAQEFLKLNQYSQRKAPQFE